MYIPTHLPSFTGFWYSKSPSSHAEQLYEPWMFVQIPLALGPHGNDKHSLISNKTKLIVYYILMTNE